MYSAIGELVSGPVAITVIDTASGVSVMLDENSDISQLTEIIKDE